LKLGDACSPLGLIAAQPLVLGLPPKLRENQAVLALLAAIPANRLTAAALAELLSRRRSCERITEALVRWSRAA